MELNGHAQPFPSWPCNLLVKKLEKIRTVPCYNPGEVKDPHVFYSNHFIFSILPPPPPQFPLLFAKQNPTIFSSFCVIARSSATIILPYRDFLICSTGRAIGTIRSIRTPPPPFFFQPRFPRSQEEAKISHVFTPD